MHWRSAEMKGTVVFLLFIAVAFPVSAQLEFLAPSTGKKLFYEVEYTSPMGNGEFYLTMISGNKAGNMVCDITFYADSLFSEKYSVSSVTYRDSADFYIVKAKDIVAFLMPSLSGLKQSGEGGEATFPKNPAPGERYGGTSVRLEGFMENMPVAMDILLGETVVHSPGLVTVPAGTFEAMKVTNESEVNLLSSPQKLYFTIWYEKGLGPLLYTVSSMEGLMRTECRLVRFQ